jgi:hypothetical protein
MQHFIRILVTNPELRHALMWELSESETLACPDHLLESKKKRGQREDQAERFTCQGDTIFMLFSRWAENRWEAPDADGDDIGIRAFCSDINEQHMLHTVNHELAEGEGYGFSYLAIGPNHDDGAKTFQDTLNGVVRLCQHEYERLANNLQANDHKANQRLAKNAAVYIYKFICRFRNSLAFHDSHYEPNKAHGNDGERSDRSETQAQERRRNVIASFPKAAGKPSLSQKTKRNSVQPLRVQSGREEHQGSDDQGSDDSKEHSYSYFPTSPFDRS